VEKTPRSENKTEERSEGEYEGKELEWDDEVRVLQRNLIVGFADIGRNSRGNR
jgi:hypothetical protein